MPHLTIPDLVPVTVPLIGDELFELDRGGASFNVAAGNIAAAPLGTIPIVTGAAPVSSVGTERAILVTTGGTAGLETLDLTNPPAPIGGFVGTAFTPLTVAVTLDVQTNGGDIVKITTNGGNTQIPLFGRSQQYSRLYRASHTDNSAVQLQFSGATAVFIWTGDRWEFWPEAVDTGCGAGWGGDNTQFVSLDSGPGQQASLNATGGDAGSVDGGSAQVTGGNGAFGHDGNGGDVTLSPGTASGAGTPGHLFALNLPTVDPGIPGAVWKDPVTHILKISP